MKNKIFSIVAFVIALSFWIFEALIHYFIFGDPIFELIPHDSNEFWMRVLIVILIIGFGIFADYYSRKLLIAQKKIEASQIYGSMIYATHHILNNLLNQIQVFKIEAQNCKDFNPDVIKLFDDSTKEASELIKRLSEVEQITEKNIWSSVDPKGIQKSSNNDNSSTVEIREVN